MFLSLFYKDFFVFHGFVYSICYNGPHTSHSSPNITAHKYNHYLYRILLTSSHKIRNNFTSYVVVRGHHFTSFVIIYEITRSRKIEYDRNYQKTRNVFENLRFCGKRKNCSIQLTSILKRLTLTRLQVFTSRIVAFKIFNSSLRFCALPHSNFISFLLPSTSLDSSADENLFHQSRACSGRPNSFH